MIVEIGNAKSFTLSLLIPCTNDLFQQIQYDPSLKVHITQHVQNTEYINTLR